MEFKNIFSEKLRWQNISLLILLCVLPNLLGMVNFSVFGFKVHLFQFAVFLAAALLGPVGGLVTGGIGSTYAAIAMNNPYIIIGNMILGVVAGILYKKGYSLTFAALGGFLVQLPWLIISDIWFVGLSVKAVGMIIVSLLLCDLLWAYAADKMKGAVKSHLGNPIG